MKKSPRPKQAAAKDAQSADSPAKPAQPKKAASQKKTAADTEEVNSRTMSVELTTFRAEISNRCDCREQTERHCEGVQRFENDERMCSPAGVSSASSAAKGGRRSVATPICC